MLIMGFLFCLKIDVSYGLKLEPVSDVCVYGSLDTSFTIIFVTGVKKVLKIDFRV